MLRDEWCPMTHCHGVKAMHAKCELYQRPKSSPAWASSDMFVGDGAQVMYIHHGSIKPSQTTDLFIPFRCDHVGGDSRSGYSDWCWRETKEG